jgi:hypothetical protein
MSRGGPAARALLALALAPLAGCVTGSFERALVDEPIPAERLAALRPGADTLAACLERLGAPNQVFEYRVAPDGSAGMALLWFWRGASGWGIDVSGGDEAAPGSVSWDALATELPGCMLWFTPELVLERWRQGLVGDLAPERRRPASPPDA